MAGYIDANQKIVTAHGIEEKILVKINRIEQWLAIRGRDQGNPVLLYLHGGPGAPFMPLSWTVESPWEDYFTVVPETQPAFDFANVDSGQQVIAYCKVPV